MGAGLPAGRFRMKHKTLRFGEGFDVVLGNRHVQAAQMVLPPGKSEGSAANQPAYTPEGDELAAGRPAEG